MPEFFYFQPTLKVCLTVVQSYIGIKGRGGAKLTSSKKTALKKPILIRVKSGSSVLGFSNIVQCTKYFIKVMKCFNRTKVY